jgi:hypothetical protein
LPEFINRLRGTVSRTGEVLHFPSVFSAKIAFQVLSEGLGCARIEVRIGDFFSWRRRGGLHRNAIASRFEGVVEECALGTIGCDGSD